MRFYPSNGGSCTIPAMSPDDLRGLRRRFRLTQVQFADRLGVSPALVASLECGRRRITERQVREIDRIFGNVYKQQPRFLANTVVSLVQKTSSSQRSGGTADKPATASGQRHKKSLTLVDLFRGFAGSAPARVTKPASGTVLPSISASAPMPVSKPVQAGQPNTAAVSNPTSVPRSVPVATWSTCTWRDLNVGLCGGLTPQGMLYCALHMTLAMIEGRPTRRR